MSKREQTILIVAVTILILFILNYFVSYPMIQSYNENIERVSALDVELQKLYANIEQGEELYAAIEDLDEKIETSGLGQYYFENYSVHNFFVDTAERYDVAVNSLSLSEPFGASSTTTDNVSQLISQDPLVAEAMTPEEISAVPAYYEIVTQTTSMNVTGTIDDILDYSDRLAKDEIYMVLPTLILTNFIENYDDVTMSLQFIEYTYQVAQPKVDVNSQTMETDLLTY